ncbi:MAG: 5-amino-6-(5-phosphoribosylamino)uracil reductase [candidate division Zixibacteria bacterium]|nr:5-amino-6-(5-phosphoribosylamino)uracil reductase [candidate division Zixibacteria bacterium]
MFRMKSIPVLTEKIVSEFEKSLQKLAQTKHGVTGLPFVTLKFAQTLDGKIATLTGDSRWISGSSSLRFAHRLRSCHQALLVGVDTIIQDDPRLTVRLVKGKSPLRIIADSRLRTPLDSGILKGKAAVSTVIATTSLADPLRIEKVQAAGAKVWIMKKDRSNRIDLRNLLRELGQRSMRSLLVEGGSKILASFLEKRLADYMVVVIAPKILGRGIDCVRVSVPPRFKRLISLSPCRFFKAGDDIIMQAPIRKSEASFQTLPS